MCWFLLIRVSVDAVERVRELLPQDLSAEALGNDSEVADDDSCQVTLHVFEGMCSCRLFNKEDTAADTDAEESKLRLRYLKKGWSTAKSERAISQWKESMRRKPVWRGVGLRPDLRSAFATFVREGQHLRIIVTWSPHDPDVPSLMSRVGARVDLVELVERDGSVLPEVLYELRVSSAPQR